MDLLLLFAIVVFFLRAAYRKSTRADRVAEAIPTLAQYLQKNPQCKTRRGIQCIVCNSMSIRNWGYEDAHDSRRLFKCNQCNTTLYRTEDW
ncbi:hypothetical protein G3N58_08900 [Paraburkholderia sp. Ac-20342]|uniref:hypothetical protein n=1 Tax=Paraburkholderia sp. Ac-20342 TaxID=2703889 RepID=UPI00197EBFD3|nr:hypothetical protein [Paraburkholderia sp. Ac-20342]MBN3846944.1 hypothetical protein [Paraburkholderia sp. Ac-20342]